MLETKRESIDRAVYRLASAVLLQAVQDSGSNSIGKRTAALRWINSNDQASFSFTFICRVLNRDPNDVRRFCESRAAARRRAYLPFRDLRDPQSPGLASFSLS